MLAGWPLVWKTSETWKCLGIWQLSGKCQGFYWKSGNCQGKNFVRVKLPKTVYCKLHICVHTGMYRVVGVCCVLNVKYVVLDHLQLHSYPTTDSKASTVMILVTCRVPRTVGESSGNFILSGEWSPCVGEVLDHIVWRVVTLCWRSFRSHCLESGQPVLEKF